MVRVQCDGTRGPGLRFFRALALVTWDSFLTATLCVGVECAGYLVPVLGGPFRILCHVVPDNSDNSTIVANLAILLGAARGF